MAQCSVLRRGMHESRRWITLHQRNNSDMHPQRIVRQNNRSWQSDDRGSVPKAGCGCDHSTIRAAVAADRDCTRILGQVAACNLMRGLSPPYARL